MSNDELAYNHYVALCVANGMEPLPFHSWKELISILEEI